MQLGSGQPQYMARMHAQRLINDKSSLTGKSMINDSESDLAERILHKSIIESLNERQIKQNTQKSRRSGMPHIVQTERKSNRSFFPDTTFQSP